MGTHTFVSKYFKAAEGEGSGHPSEPQPPPSTAQPTNKEPIPTIVSSSHLKTQTPRQALKEVTELPQTSEPIPNVPDEAVYEEWDDGVGRATTTAASLDASQASGNITMTQPTTIPNVPLSHEIGTCGSLRCQEAMGGSIAQTRSEKVPTQSYDSPLPRVNTLGTDEGSMTLYELTVLCIKLSNKVESLETELKQTKQTYGAAFTKLIKKVKKLEKTVKTSQARRRAKIIISNDEEDSEDSSKQERKIDEIDQDPDITLVQHDAEIQGRHGQEMEFETKVSTTKDISTAETLVYIRRSATKDKGKAKMVEFETKQTKTKLQQRQERAGYEAAVRLQEQLDEEERKRIARVHEEASSFNIEEWEDIQATIEADEELAQRIQAEEREKYSEAEKARLLAELINQRKRYFAQQRAEERRNKPLTQAQQRTYMSNYIKHMGSHTLQQLKRLSFDELKNLFEATMRRVGAFVPMETEIRREVPELAAGSSKRDAEEELDQGSSKRQKTSENSEPAEESKEKEDDELSQEELQQLMIIVPEEGMNVEALQTKYPIIDWEVYTEDSRMY
ncbi:hypothetical protein Tco_0822162 [Tanacetum coccineum]|uniref:Uncharacterized protein n=1 Tax=Tanacetum coccineum TaxID=301880 RepID=A0ABQ5AIM2_9ASTR